MHRTRLPLHRQRALPPRDTVRTSDAHTEAAWFGVTREITDLTVVARITIDGEPQSKARPRWNGHNTYTPARTVAAEQNIAAEFTRRRPGYRPRGDIAFGVVGLFFAYTRQRRDVDNMLKLICDALNDVAWVDDSQVLEITGRKDYVDQKDHARTEILIYELPAPSRLTIPCAGCGAPMQTYRSWSGIRRFCSSDCRKKLAAPSPPCATCGRPVGSKHRKFCSKECRSRGGRISVTCEQCGAGFDRFKSWAKNGRPFCTDECRATYWRIHRATAARGTCATCGGSTSKKTYTRCRSCTITEKERAS
jgi:Holliday junction resolvase RusA-like endonuclease/endogenous inhibitor of DNA gyrase (YacG/DUF329 family)